ncbi:PepSY domain-containing protein [Paracoccus sp. pheM1]|uniref:PepSY domain-containing protein n=1 Tax=Paracoccus simplex TaxID=2086346 RepID=A0ABV7RZU6_9RHOB|nr:PepSY domain-containing protein [Paracoccus sp. pheM1]MBT0779423.1 PepSY domain-containing protein [Paracoccus sp. pheM1]
MKTILTATAFALAIPAGAALADEKCNVPTENMQSWEALIQVTDEFGWSISKMELDDGCYELNVIDQGGNTLKMTVDPGTLEVIDGKVKRWSDGTKPAKRN